MKKWVFLIGLLSASAIFSAETTVSSFLKEGGGIRSMSMGGAFTAIAEGDGAMLHNPAGLAIPGGVYVYQDLDNRHDAYENFKMHAFYNRPIGYTYLSQEDADGDNVATTYLGYGRRGSNGVDWGINYKLIKANVEGVETDSWSSDLGILFHVLPNVNIGTVAHDLLKKDLNVGTSFTTGVAFFPRTRKWTLSTDIDFENKDNVYKSSVSYGGELFVAEGLTLLGGYSSSQDITGGVNFILPFMEVEYGILKSRYNGSTHMVGLTFGQGVAHQSMKRRYSMFKQGAFATFSLGQNVTGGKSEVSLLGGQRIGSNDLLALIHEASRDKSCQGFIIRVGNVSSSISSVGLIQEIREELLKSKASGKKIYVYIDNWATLPDYYLATVADKIYMPELGSISHLGLEMEIKKTRRFLSNFGLKTTIIANGYYKDGLQPGGPPLTALERYHLENVVDGLYHQVLMGILAERSLDQSVIDKAFDGRLLTATEAKELGLVDGLVYWDEMLKLLNEDKKSETVSNVNLEAFAPLEQGPTLLNWFNRIAILEIDGGIMMGENNSNVLFGGNGTGADSIKAAVEAIKKDRLLRGVIIRVNSPGGSMLASDVIYEAIAGLKGAGKTVYTSMGSIAASGGYYVALNSHKIYANPGTLTGSIGVISSYMTFESFNQTLGFDYETIKTGKYMDLMTPRREMTPDERMMVYAHQESYYQTFVKRLRDNRGLTEKEAYDVAQGQVFTGEQAKELNVIDEIGGFYDTVDQLASDLNITDPQLVFVRPKTRFTLPFLNVGFLSNLSKVLKMMY